MSLTIAFMTNRRDPKIEWFAHSLRREIRDSGWAPSEIIIVDYHTDDMGRRQYIEDKINPWTELSPKVWHIAPKPCAVQGAHRKTSKNHFAASNARNTAFAKCSSDYIACVDDLSVLNQGWLNQVKHAHDGKYVVLGSYKKVLNVICDPSGAFSFKDFPSGVDSRWSQGDPNGIKRVGGSWMFGCSFGLPIEFAEKVNGFDELCDMVGMEDVEFGIRLERAGCPIFYNRNMLTYESEELHHAQGNEKFLRESLPHASGVNSDWYIYNGVVHKPKTWTEGNDFTLSDLRKNTLAGLPFPLPTKTVDWRTGNPFSES